VRVNTEARDARYLYYGRSYNGRFGRDIVIESSGVVESDASVTVANIGVGCQLKVEKLWPEYLLFRNGDCELIASTGRNTEQGLR